MKNQLHLLGKISSLVLQTRNQQRPIFAMAGGGGVVGERQLDQTPTWAVATVCAVIILLSIVLEKFLHRAGEWFTRRLKTALFEALEKAKSELMILGFISLLLTFGQSYITRI